MKDLTPSEQQAIFEILAYSRTEMFTPMQLLDYQISLIITIIELRG